jgi:energy-coupling factor transport system substrate-specific component
MSDRAAARPRRTTVVAIRWRSAVALALASAVGVVGFGWPLLAAPGSRLSHASDSPWLFALLLPLLLAVVLAEVSDGGMDAKAVALLGVLAAIGAALRPLGAGAAGIEPMFFLLVLAGRVLGRGFGFVLGAIALFASALLTGGVGPWLSFQMLGAGWVGFGAGCLPRRARGRVELALLAGYGVVAGLGYGLLLNLSLWPFLANTYDTAIAFRPDAPLPENLRRLIAFTLSTSLGFDIPRAVTNVVLILAAGPPVLLALRRAARRAAFDAPVVFTPPAVDRPGATKRTGGPGPTADATHAAVDRRAAAEPAAGSRTDRGYTGHRAGRWPFAPGAVTPLTGAWHDPPDNMAEGGT